MKILRESTIIKMKAEIISKMVDAVKEALDRVDKGMQGEEVLDIVLKHFYKEPSGRVSYGWTNTDRMENLIKGKE